MTDSDPKTLQKETLREQAKKARGMMPPLDAAQQRSLCENFFTNIAIEPGICVASYWPSGRELDTQILMEELVERGVQIALPVVDKKDAGRVLKFARWAEGDDLQKGAYDICHPVVNDATQWVEPDIFLVPLLAFDRRGCRLGYGGGYYDATLAAYRTKNEKILAVGLGYAQQACLFNLPAQEHDEKMDWIITEQGAFRY